MILERDEPFKTKFHGFTGVDANSECDSAMGKIIGVSNLTLHEAMSRKGKLRLNKNFQVQTGTLQPAEQFLCNHILDNAAHQGSRETKEPANEAMCAEVGQRQSSHRCAKKLRPDSATMTS